MIRMDFGGTYSETLQNLSGSILSINLLGGRAGRAESFSNTRLAREEISLFFERERLNGQLGECEELEVRRRSRRERLQQIEQFRGE